MIVVQGSDNVFEDLGFEPEEAVNLKIREDLFANYANQEDNTASS